MPTVISFIRIQDEMIPVDQTLVFQHICVTKHTNEVLNDHFKYEWAPCSISNPMIFENGSMRKTAKSALFVTFQSESLDLPLNVLVLYHHWVPFRQNDD